MFLKQVFPLLAFTAQICSTFVIEPIAPYAGQHSNKCWQQSKITGALVKNKIYTFGGCYPLPYIFNPEDDDADPFFSSMSNKINTSSTVHAYDITQDTWTLETQTPLPLNGANLQVVGDDIYFFNLHVDPDHHRSRMWKYSTGTKEWKVLEELPFIWLGRLVSCEHDGIIHLVGSDDYRNRVQRYDTIKNKWLDSAVSDFNLYVENMFCAQDALQLVGRRLRYNPETRFLEPGEIPQKDLEFITVPYQDGKARDTEFNVTVSHKTNSIVYGDWLYSFDIRKQETIVTKANPLTQEVVQLGSINQTLRNGLFIPYRHKIIYLIGGRGRVKTMSSRNHEPREGEWKTYNHKIQLVADNHIQE